MKLPVFHIKAVLLIPLFLLTLTSCTAGTPAQRKLGADADYFRALTLLSENKETEAINKFTHCFKRGTYYCARASAMELCEFGSLQDKNEACIKMLQKFKDTETLILACQHFKESNEISKIIEYTYGLDFSTENNKLIRLRLEALHARHDSSYESEVYKWFSTCKISQEHYQFYRDFYEHPDFEQEEVLCTPKQFAINYRIETYKRNYTYTYLNSDKIINSIETKSLEPNEQLASDIGKAFLYGNMKFTANAQLFKTYAQQFQNTPMEYYFWYYAGRFYEKAGTYYTQTKKCFQQAALTAPTPSQKDDALWYIMDISLRSSTIEQTLEVIKECAKQWSNPADFDNFFEKLLSSLLISGKWTTLYDIYTALDSYASNEIIAQYAYIYGRLVEEGMISQEITGRQSTSDMMDAFKRATHSDSSTYYKIMALNKLQLPQQEFNAIIADTNYVTTQPVNQAVENIIKGCVLFGFPDKLYPVWKELNSKGVSTDTAFYASDFLNKCSTGNDDYYQQSLRIASRAAATAQRPLKKEELKLLYPQNYLETIQTYCDKYNLKKSVMFSLIRSESFFDPDVVSSAGAIGLTQLMDFTGGDIARRLKLRDYSLEDPQTNIEFGTYYLSELVRRCDGSYLQAFFSYNAGITRVRKWLKSSMVEFGLKQDMPLDLFLESLPYAETREYGRKLISAGVMYEWIYDNSCKPFGEIVNYFVN